MRRLAAFFLASCLTLLTACGGWASPVTPEPAATSRASIKTSSGPQKASGGTLRLWWPPRAGLNPLHEETEAGRAAYDLVYEGLFKINENETLSFALAERMLVFEAGLQVLLAVQDDLRFHDGRPVTSQDVAACLDYLLDPDCSSIWRLGLENIASVAALEGNVVEIRLHEPDPWLAWSLVFPVIPADEVFTADFSPIPGTGPYQINTYTAEQGTELSPVVQEDPALPDILLKEYESQQKAMQALENDQLDLVLLDSSLYSKYVPRTNIRLDYFTAREAVFLSCNTRPGSQLGQEGQLAALKGLLATFRVEENTFADWAQSSGYACSAASVFLPEPVIDNRRPDGLAGVQLRIIIPEEDSRRQKLADQLAAYLADLAVELIVDELAADEFWQELQTGSYDLALLSARLPYSPAADFLFRQPLADYFRGLDLVRADSQGLAGEGSWQEQLHKIQPWQKNQEENTYTSNPEWVVILAELTKRAPWEILCLPYAGLVYGDRVRGQCRPDAYHPYAGIKELWLWSTQS